MLFVRPLRCYKRKAKVIDSEQIALVRLEGGYQGTHLEKVELFLVFPQNVSCLRAKTPPVRYTFAPDRSPVPA
jgi:hypothetical protein